MAKRIRKRKCKHCRLFFPPEPRNARNQKYCSKLECRKAGKAASQKKWLLKEENRHYFLGPTNVLRVQEWRKANPGYWRRKSSENKDALQDSLSGKSKENPPVSHSFASGALQDVLSFQPAVLIGLIAQLTGTALQDDIANTARRLQQLGDDILNRSNLCKGGSYDFKTPYLPTSSPQSPQTVQLGGSPSGP